MRSMSWQQANNCENAKHPRCQCRCAGALHGAKRGRVADLPYDDPHSPTSTCKRCSGSGQAPKFWPDQPDAPCRACSGTGHVFVGKVPEHERSDKAAVL